MVGDGYQRDAIHNVKRCIDFALEVGASAEVTCYEDLFFLLAEKLGYTSDRPVYDSLRTAMGHVKAFDEEGLLPDRGRRREAFLPKKVRPYSCLNDGYKGIIDAYRASERASRKRPNTVYSETNMASLFLLHCQRNGEDVLSAITERTMIAFFYDGESVIRGKDCRSLILAVLKDTEEYPRLLFLMPNPKSHRKGIDYLKPEEVRKIRDILHDDESELTPLERAVGLILFYLGVRGTDIVSLTFKDIDWEKNEIAFIQSKTGVPLTLPLLTVVGNAIVIYLREQREKGGTTVFTTQVRPHRRFQGLGHIIASIFEKAGVRADGGARGVRLFRHNLATYLVTNGVESAVVSEVLGHTSPESLNHYVDMDVEGLRTCSMDISRFCRVGEGGLFAI